MGSGGRGAEGEVGAHIGGLRRGATTHNNDDDEDDEDNITCRGGRSQGPIVVFCIRGG